MINVLYMLQIYDNLRTKASVTVCYTTCYAIFAYVIQHVFSSKKI